MARLFANGKITVPQDVRTALNVKDGDYVSVIIWKTEILRPGEKR